MAGKGRKRGQGMIICPKCGKVKEYGIKECLHRVGIFNENHECIKTTENTDFRFEPPRCLKCNSIVRFYIEPQAESEGKE